MGFLLSGVLDITESLPMTLSGGYRRAVEAAELADGFDVAVGGMSFLLRPSTQAPYERGLLPAQKDQLDTSKAPGEQTLGAWWTRAQNDFTGGSGVTWYDPGSEEATQRTFKNSLGVNVWGDDVTLVRAMNKVDGVTEPGVLATGAIGVYRGHGTTLSRHLAHDSVAWTATVSGPVNDVAVGAGLIWTSSTAGVSKVTSSGSASAAWFTGSADGVWWVKGRLVIASGPSLYWTARDTATGPISGLNLIHTAAAGTKWTAVAESGDAIIASSQASATGDSAVYSISLDQAASTDLPALGAPMQVWQSPRSEMIRGVWSYLSTYLVILTTVGWRVALLAEGSRLSVGQVTLPATADGASVAFRDRWAYIPHVGDNGKVECFRIDLSAPLADTTQYAAAGDVYIDDDEAVAGAQIAFLGQSDRVVLAANNGVWVEDEADLVTSGWVETGRVRYLTDEMKMFTHARLSGRLADGNVQIAYRLSERGAWETAGAVISSHQSTKDIPLPFVPGKWLQLRLTLNKSLSNASPGLASWSLMALPVVAQPLLIRLPLSCLDREQSRHGVPHGYDGWAWDRLSVLEHLLNSEKGIPVKFAQGGKEYICVAADYSFTASAAPDGNNDNFGGIVMLTLRTIRETL